MADSVIHAAVMSGILAGLPLVIHTRGASDDTVAMLRSAQQAAGGALTGVFHCFTETAEVARAALDLGFMISFSGILTFKNAADLRDVAAFVPLDRCLIETDSPYLAPVPYRGKTIAAREISIAPYLDDPLRVRFEKYANKTYVFTLSDAVPGGLYAIRTRVAGATPEAAPLIADEMVVDGGTPLTR